MIILSLISSWILGVKMGLKGWELFVPFYGEYKLCEKVLGNGWFVLLLLLLLIPVVGALAVVVLLILFLVKLVHKFGYRGWFVFGLFFVPWVFEAVIAFGDHTFEGQIPNENDYLYKALLMIKEKIRSHKLEEVPVQYVAPGTCPNCGFVNNETAAFCEKCGTKLG